MCLIEGHAGVYFGPSAFRRKGVPRVDRSRSRGEIFYDVVSIADRAFHARYLAPTIPFLYLLSIVATKEAGVSIEEGGGYIIDGINNARDERETRVRQLIRGMFFDVSECSGASRPRFRESAPRTSGANEGERERRWRENEGAIYIERESR